MGHDEIVRIFNEYKIQQGELPPKIVVPTKIDTLTAENASCFFNNPGKLASDLAPVNVDVDPPKYAAESQLQFS